MSYPHKIHGRFPKKLVIFTLNNSYIYTPQRFFITVLPLLRSFFFPNGPSLIFIMVLLFFVCVYMGTSHAGGCIVLVAMFLWSQSLKNHNLVLNYTYKSIWPWIALFPESTSPVKGSQTTFEVFYCNGKKLKILHRIFICFYLRWYIFIFVKCWALYYMDNRKWKHNMLY